MPQTPQQNLKDNLLEKILNRIEKEKEKKIKKNIILSFSGVIFSVISLFLIWPMVYNDFVGSGFIYYFSTMLMHFDFLRIYFEQFLILLLESLPIFGLLLLLVNLFVFITSLKTLLKNYRYVSFKFLFSRN